MKKEDSHTKQNGRSLESWRRLADRYFDAQTTEAEERQLRLFLATEAAAGEEFDEIKAVMGFLVTGKAWHQAGKASLRTEKRRTLPLCNMKWVAAALIFLVAGITTWRILDSRKNICVAYIYGEKCTDAREVMSHLRLSVGQMQHAEEDITVESQLNDIFQTLEEEDVITISK